MLDRLMDAFQQLDIESLCQRETTNGGDDSDEGTELFLVTDKISMATWNEFARLDRLPHGLQLRQLLWVNDEVFIVQAAIGPAHECAAGWVNIRVGNALGGDGGIVRWTLSRPIPRRLFLSTEKRPPWPRGSAWNSIR